MDSKAAGRYAEALFSLSLDEHKTDEWQQQIRVVDEVFRENPKLSRLFSHVKISAQEKKDLMRNAFEGADREIMNFLQLLVDKGRVANILEITREFERLCNEEKGIKEGRVSSPYALSAEEVARIEEAVGKKIGKKVKLRAFVDESLIRGIRVEVEGTVLDGSMRSQLESMRRSLREAR